MGELANLRDFMLIARAIEPSAEFLPRLREALRLAAASHPEIAWRAYFDVSPRDHVEIFSAPDFAAAREVSALLSGVQGMRAELAPLKNRW
jgi:hypothetical protein